MQVDAATQQQLERKFKIKLLTQAYGLQALKQVLASDETQLLVAYGSQSKINGMLAKASASDSAATAAPAPAPAASSQQPSIAEQLLKAIAVAVKQQTSEFISLPVEVLDSQEDWANFGFDSILLSGLAEQLNGKFDLELMPTVFFEATNIELLTQYLSENHRDEMAKALQLTISEETGTATAAADALSLIHI